MDSSLGGQRLRDIPPAPDAAECNACAQVIYSGGGFSNVFKMPSYQQSAVEEFMTKYTPEYSTDIYNATGSRGYPDISANG